MSLTEAAAALEKALRSTNWNSKFPPYLPPILESPVSQLRNKDKTYEVGSGDAHGSTIKQENADNINFKSNFNRENCVGYSKDFVRNKCLNKSQNGSMNRNGNYRHEEENMNVFHSIPSFPFHDIGRKYVREKPYMYSPHRPRQSLPAAAVHGNATGIRKERSKSFAMSCTSTHDYGDFDSKSERSISNSSSSASNEYKDSTKILEKINSFNGAELPKSFSMLSEKEHFDCVKAAIEYDNHEDKGINSRKRKGNTLDFIRKSAKMDSNTQIGYNVSSNSISADEIVEHSLSKVDSEFGLMFPSLKISQTWNSYVNSSNVNSLLDNFDYEFSMDMNIANNTGDITSSGNSSSTTDCKISPIESTVQLTKIKFQEKITESEQKVISKASIDLNNNEIEPIFEKGSNFTTEVREVSHCTASVSDSKASVAIKWSVDFQSSMEAFVQSTNDEGFMSSSPKSSIMNVHEPDTTNENIDNEDGNNNQNYADKNSTDCAGTETIDSSFPLLTDENENTTYLNDLKPHDIVSDEDMKNITTGEIKLDSSEQISNNEFKQPSQGESKNSPGIPQHIVEKYFPKEPETLFSPEYKEPTDPNLISETSSITDNSYFAPLDPNKYKTELCRAFQLRGSCKYGSRCNYAHGLDQLKVSFHHGKYKTRNCEAYHETGYCRYGARCSFIHDLEEGILKCSIANKEILEALHYWPEDDFPTSATVTWKVFNGKSHNSSDEDSLVEFTAIPSLRPADIGPVTDLSEESPKPVVYSLQTKGVTSVSSNSKSVKTSALVPMSTSRTSSSANLRHPNPQSKSCGRVGSTVIPTYNTRSPGLVLYGSGRNRYMDSGEIRHAREGIIRYAASGSNRNVYSPHKRMSLNVYNPYAGYAKNDPYIASHDRPVYRDEMDEFNRTNSYYIPDQRSSRVPFNTLGRGNNMTNYESFHPHNGYDSMYSNGGDGRFRRNYSGSVDKENSRSRHYALNYMNRTDDYRNEGHHHAMGSANKYAFDVSRKESFPMKPENWEPRNNGYRTNSERVMASCGSSIPEACKRDSLQSNCSNSYPTRRDSCMSQRPNVAGGNSERLHQKTVNFCKNPQADGNNTNSIHKPGERAMDEQRVPLNGGQSTGIKVCSQKTLSDSNRMENTSSHRHEGMYWSERQQREDCNSNYTENYRYGNGNRKENTYSPHQDQKNCNGTYPVKSNYQQLGNCNRPCTPSQTSQTKQEKMKKCFNFYKRGFCLYGGGCQFLHDPRNCQ